MASSEVTICNKALGLLGIEPISSLAEDSKEARFCNVFYADARDALLVDAPWAFAIEDKELTLLSETPLEFSYSYQKPTNCLKVVSLYPQNIPFKVQGSKIFTNSTPEHAKCIMRITDVSLFSPSFKEALQFKLANQLAYALKQSVSLASAMYNKYAQVLKDARSVDSMEGTSELLQQDVWLDSMHGFPQDYP